MTTYEILHGENLIAEISLQGQCRIFRSSTTGSGFRGCAEDWFKPDLGSRSCVVCGEDKGERYVSAALAAVEDFIVKFP